MALMSVIYLFSLYVVVSQCDLYQLLLGLTQTFGTVSFGVLIWFTDILYGYRYYSFLFICI